MQAKNSTCQGLIKKTGSKVRCTFQTKKILNNIMQNNKKHAKILWVTKTNVYSKFDIKASDNNNIYKHM